MDNETVLNIMLTDGTFWFDILEDVGDSMGEVTHGFTVEPHELPAITLTMMEIKIQEETA